MDGGEDGREPLKLIAFADEAPRLDPATLAAGNGVGGVITLGDLEPEWLWSMDRVKLPKIGVHGNHDEHGTLDALGVEDVHLRRVEIGDWSFAGFAGCVKYGRGPYQFTQREAAKLAKRLPAADVLVCHCPPSGVNDEPDDLAHHRLRGAAGVGRAPPPALHPPRAHDARPAHARASLRRRARRLGARVAGRRAARRLSGSARTAARSPSTRPGGRRTCRGWTRAFL